MTASAGPNGIDAAVTDETCSITLRLSDVGSRLNHAAMQEFVTQLRAARDSGALLLHIRAEGPDFCLGRLQGEQVPGLTRTDALGMILQANEALSAFPGVSLAQVHGRAFGFGAGLALQCDLTVADADASFAFDEVDHGLAPLVVAEYLPRYIGRKRAQAMVLTGEVISAATAERWGMVTHLADAGESASEAARILSNLRAFEPGALRLMKRYDQAILGQELSSPREDAVQRLAEWLGDGRPHHPTW